MRHMGPFSAEHGKRKALTPTARTSAQANCRTHPTRNVFTKVGKACQIKLKSCWKSVSNCPKLCWKSVSNWRKSCWKSVNAQVKGNFEFYRPTNEKQHARKCAQAWQSPMAMGTRKVGKTASTPRSMPPISPWRAASPARPSRRGARARAAGPSRSCRGAGSAR